LLLPHISRYYRLIINQAEVTFQLIEANLSARLAWDRGVILFNTALDTPIPLPTTLPVVLSATGLTYLAVGWITTGM